MAKNILDSSDLIEQLSEQVHETWMANRISEGWSYGPERNDSIKQTPCIVPYNELPEIEKDYDRNTVRTTIKALYDLGFSITKRGGGMIKMSNIFGNFIFWTALSFIVLIVFSCIAFTARKGKRRNYKYMAIMFMLGIYLSNVTFISPLIFFGNVVDWKEQVSSYKDVSIKEFSTKLPEKSSVFSHFSTEFKITDSELLLRDSVLYGLIYSTKMSGLGVKYQALIPTSFYFSIFSGIFFIILTILSPIAFGGLVASFFEGALGFIHYFLAKNFCDIYYFSNLNEKSILLAKNIHKNQKRSLIVFCNKNKKIDNSLLEKVKYSVFILTTRSELDFAKKSRYARHFFEMGKDESKNLSDVYAILKEYEKFSKKKNFKVYLFAEKETSFEAINRTAGRENVIILNRFRTAFYNILFKKPLYKCLENSGRTDFSITVIGAGKCGSEIIKACIWCTQLGADYSTKINVIDKQASFIESQLKKECPELISNYYIKFYDCDITTETFYDLLNERCLDANYIAIATGYDDMNLNIAIDVRRLYLRNSSKYDNEPTIMVYIENDRFKASNGKIFDDFKIESFGSDEEFYSYSLIIDSEIEKLAKNSSCVYDYWKNNKIENNKKEIIYYRAREIERDSNRTNAIHLVYKLYRYGFGIIEKRHAEQEQINAAPKLLEQLKEILSDENAMNNLAYIEHGRWNAFYRSEGWRGVPYKNWNTFYKKFNSQKNHLLKQHACICPYDKLEKAEEIFKMENNDKELVNNDFRGFDYAYIKYLTKTLGLEKEESSEINISGVEYILAPLPKVKA